MARSNQAAYLPGPNKERIEIASAPTYTPGPRELLIRTRAVAFNPVDVMKQEMGNSLFPWLKYPTILGNDVAGEVVDIGSSVTRFNKGDRVLALTLGMNKRGRQPDEGGFQEYVIVRENLTAECPAIMSFEDACVLPLGMSTAACGLFQDTQLGLKYPSVGAVKNGEILVVWGASTSVGMNAVQLAVGAGYEVFGTASPKNWDTVRRLGAAKMFDYRSSSVVEDMILALKGKRCAGAVAIGDGSLGKCIEIVSRAENSNKVVAQISIDLPGEFPTTKLGMVPFGIMYMWMSFRTWLKLKRSGVRAKFVWGSDVVDFDADGRIFGFVTDALAKGSYKSAPEAMVVGKGLGSVQKGLDTILAGVSAKKVVVSLDD